MGVRGQHLVCVCPRSPGMLDCKAQCNLWKVSSATQYGVHSMILSSLIVFAGFLVHQRINSVYYTFLYYPVQKKLRKEFKGK